MPLTRGIRRALLQGAGGITYLLRDDFTTAVTAPMASSRAAEPGPGTMTKNLDGGNYGSINASAEFDWSGGGGVFTGDPNYRWDAVTRASGRVAYFRVITGAAVTGSMFVGLIQAATVANNWVNNAHCFYFQASVFGLLFNATANLNTSNIANISTSTTYDLMLWMHSTGALWLIKGGAFTVWTPLFHELITTTATVYPVNTNSNAVHNQKTMRVFDVPTTYAVDYPLATVNATNPTTGTIYTATANALHEMFFTLPGSPSAGDTVTMMYRASDANNGIRVKIIRNVGNTAWDINVRKVTAGVESTPSGWSDVTGIGTPDAMQVVVSNSGAANVYTKATTTWTKRGSEISDSTHSSNTGLLAQYAVGSVSKLTSLPADDSYGGVVNPFLAA